MEDRTRSAWRLIIVIALGMVVVRLLQGCATYVPPQVTPKVEYKVILAPYRLQFTDSLPLPGSAVTSCEAGGSTVITMIRNLSAQQYAELIAHEVMHVRQMAVWMGVHKASCKDYLALYVADPNFRLVIEAEAYCSGLKVLTEVTGAVWQSEVSGVVRFLADNYSLGKTDEEVFEAVKKACNPP